jgi:outer membrane protein OmpA-like peptidoglycan-associated protein
MRSRSVSILAMVGLLGLSGCSAMQERRWGMCAVAGGLVGAAVGAGTAGGLVNAYEGGDGGNRKETGAAAGSGAVVGAAVGTLLGHVLCDPKEMPPPPPPAAAPPPPPPPPPAPRKLETISGPNFDFDKSRLRPEGQAKVDRVVKLMEDNPSMHVAVEGHTDSIGSDAYNQRLSEQRAAAVRDYMVSKGISGSRITSRGYGKTRPIADNKTASGRAQNRRVEIISE